MQDQNLLDGELDLNSQGIESLMESTKWAKFIGVLGYVFSGVMGVSAIFIALSMAQMGDTPPDLEASQEMVLFKRFGGLGLSILYIVLAAIGFLLSHQFYKYATKLTTGIATKNSFMINSAFAHLNRLFKTYGILLMIYLFFLLLVIIGTVFTAATQ